MRFTVLLTFTVIAACVVASAQRATPTARKFDEYSVGIGHPGYRVGYFEEHQKEVKTRLALYGLELRKAGARPYAITYTPRIVPWEIYDRSIAEMRAGALWELTPLADWRNINIVNGGFREIATTELWIVPPGAQPPCPTPTVKPEDVIYCPYVRIASTPFVPNPESAINFSAVVEVNSSKVRPTFAWKVSQGRIINGQGTEQISVRVPSGSQVRVVARVTLEGFSLECSAESTSAMSQTAVGFKHYLLDEFANINWEDELARLDNLAVTLQNDASLQVHLVFYGGRFRDRGQALVRANRDKSYLTMSRGVEGDRILVVDGGLRHESSGEFWLSVRGSPPPPTRETVEPQYSRPKSLQ